MLLRVVEVEQCTWRGGWLDGTCCSGQADGGKQHCAEATGTQDLAPHSKCGGLGAIGVGDPWIPCGFIVCHRTPLACESQRRSYPAQRVAAGAGRRRPHAGWPSCARAFPLSRPSISPIVSQWTATAITTVSSIGKPRGVAAPGLPSVGAAGSALPAGVQQLHPAREHDAGAADVAAARRVACKAARNRTRGTRGLPAYKSGGTRKLSAYPPPIGARPLSRVA